ncbi:MAG: hypothetical protein PQJ58_21140 [Spirochaetales bacterium]|nr:hypothetical protein [Spirochaetales bacterium]
MISDKYREYTLTACPRKTRQGRWSVAVEIRRTGENTKPSTFFAEDGISYILEEEAAKECLNLGRNLINRNQLS